MKLTKSQLIKIIKEELGDPEGEAEYEREKKARIAWKRKFTSVEEVEAIVDLMINDPEFRMLQGYAEEFKRRSQRGTPPQNALEGILPEYVPGGLINTIIVKARERLPADETRIERPKGTGASAADMDRWESDYRNESKQNTKMKLTKSQLIKIIKEELSEAYGGALGSFPERYGDAHKQRIQVAADELENFLNTYVVDNPLYSLDAETSKTLFAGYAESMGMPPSVEALQDMYDSLARNMDPYDRSHMADLEGGY